MKTLVIVPAYNEEKSLLKTIEDIKKNTSFCDYIVINDASTDNTEYILIKNKIKHLTLSTNLGLHGAIQTGLKYAKYYGYDACVQFDGDGQHEAKYIRELQEEIIKGSNIVIGSRFVNSKKEMSLRMIGSRVLTFLIYLKTHNKITDPTSGMRMYDRKCIELLADDIFFRPEPDAIARLIKKNYKVSEIEVTMKVREEGVSIYASPISAIKYMIKMSVSIMFLS